MLPRTTIVTYGLLSLAGIVSITLPVSESRAAPPDVLRLDGVIRDFSSDHPDFSSGIRPPGNDHYVGNVASTLDSDGQPVFTGSGQTVITQWYDQDGNTIRPYAGPGLPGGHFDVDVYDDKKRKYHKHEFDDEYDVTYIDIANDPNLKFESLVGSSYPNNLRLVFYNVHNGGLGTYAFEAGGGVQTGDTADGLDITFDPALLTQLQVNFMALAFLRPTAPGTVKKDSVDRDDSFGFHMYDVVTNTMVYEVSVYHHYKEGEVFGGTETGEDACGVQSNDIHGAYGGAGVGGINDAETFYDWFHNRLGANLSQTQTITLQRNAAGDFEYWTDSFFPIDGRLMGNEGDEHNNYFTYAISASFT